MNQERFNKIVLDNMRFKRKIVYYGRYVKDDGKASSYSLGLIIPKVVCQLLDIHYRDKVEIILQTDDSFIIRKVK